METAEKSARSDPPISISISISRAFKDYWRSRYLRIQRPELVSLDKAFFRAVSWRSERLSGLFEMQARSANRLAANKTKCRYVARSFAR